MNVLIPTFEQFVQALTNAIAMGSLYALIAIGYTMVYGILRLINFAHGDILMMSMYFAFYIVSLFRLPWYAAFILGTLGIGLLGMLIERAAYKPLRSAPRISLLISAIGVSFLMENLATVVFFRHPETVPIGSLFPGGTDYWQGSFAANDPDCTPDYGCPCIRTSDAHQKNQDRHGYASGQQGFHDRKIDGNQCQSDHFIHILHWLHYGRDRSHDVGSQVSKN